MSTDWQGRPRTVLIAWELGAGMGHIARASSLAFEFAAQGDRVFVVLKSLRGATSVAWPDSARLFQAPILSVTHQVAEICNHAEILLASGYHDVNSLRSLVVGWSSLIELIEPDVVVADHAPTATLVAKLASIPVVRLGAGFFAPPSMSPFPVFRTWATVAPERLAAVEAQVLGVINGVAQSCSVVFDRVAQAMEPDLDLITSWPELDHYAGVRKEGAAEFIGPERFANQGSPVVWSGPGNGPKVLAYLKADFSGFLEVMRSLEKVNATTVAFVLNESNLAQPMRPSENVTIRQEMFDPWSALRECDVLVCNAGIGMVATALEAGKPVLMMPYTTEQYIFAGRVQQTGAGLRLDEQQVATNFFPHLEAFLSSPSYGENARALAQKHGSQGDAIPRAVERIRQLIDSQQSG